MAFKIKTALDRFASLAARHGGWLALAGCISLSPNRLSAAESVTLTYESAPSIDGPWSKVDPRLMQVNANGSATVETEAKATFFRMRVSADGQETSIPVVTLSKVPVATLSAARNQLTRLAAEAGSEAEEWAGAELSPFAAPLTDRATPGGTTYYEFKISAKPKLAITGGFRKFDSDENRPSSRGYMICSGDRSDLPIVQFATEGESVVDNLLRKCGGVTPARVVRYGASFWVAEDERGALIANHGTEPFKVPPEMVEEMSRVAAGLMDTETGQNDLPPAMNWKPSFYRSYAEFKADYETNAVYQLLRTRRAEHAKAYWDAEAGLFPEVLTLRVGETAAFLAGQRITRLIVDIESDEKANADLTLPRLGGLQAVGRIAGRMGIKVVNGETITRYVIEVRPRILAAEAELNGTGSGPLQAAALSPYWKTITEAYAGDWGDQLRWYQLRRDDWCELVGCGPLAIGMLLGWWEREKNVPSAFYRSVVNFSSLSNVDAPKYLDTSGKRALVRDALAKLHDYCDVLCDPFSDAGATMPGDLIEGWQTYLFPVANTIGSASVTYGNGNPLVGYSASWAYDYWGDDWEYSGSKVASGIKDGRPGVVGLGVLWHYVVAYGYFREDLMATIGGTEMYQGVRRRFFKCNEGWGNSSPAWYSAHDVFLGLTANVWQRRSPQQP